jgi:hypothetical protein
MFQLQAIRGFKAGGWGYLIVSLRGLGLSLLLLLRCLI